MIIEVGDDSCVIDKMTIPLIWLFLFGINHAFLKLVGLAQVFRVLLRKNWLFSGLRLVSLFTLGRVVI